MHAVTLQHPRELLQGLTALLQPLESFNARHAGGRSAGLLLGEVIHRTSAHTHDELTKELPNTAAASYRSEFEALQNEYAALLSGVGLALKVDEGIEFAKEILRDYGITHETLGHDLNAITIHVAELVIDDFDRFIDFLHALKGPRSHNLLTPDALEVLSKIGDTLVATLERFDVRRKLGYTNSGSQQTLDNSQQLVDLLHDIQVTAMAEHLSEIVYRAACGDLSEYLLAKRHNLLPNDPQGPQSWHRTLTAQEFGERWKMARAVSHDLTASGDTDLSTRVADHLHAVARNTFREIQRELATARPHPHLRQHGEAMLAVLTSTLEGLSSP